FSKHDLSDYSSLAMRLTQLNQSQSNQTQPNAEAQRILFNTPLRGTRSAQRKTRKGTVSFGILDGRATIHTVRYQPSSYLSLSFISVFLCDLCVPLKGVLKRILRASALGVILRVGCNL